VLSLLALDAERIGRARSWTDSAARSTRYGSRLKAPEKERIRQALL